MSGSVIQNPTEAQVFSVVLYPNQQLLARCCSTLTTQNGGNGDQTNTVLLPYEYTSL